VTVNVEFQRRVHGNYEQASDELGAVGKPHRPQDNLVAAARE
jgi:hypothetical protein